MQPQVLGHPKSKVTRKAQRFFSDRGVQVTFNDLRKRPPTPGELRKWVERFGVDGVVDRESAPYRDRGMGYLSTGVDRWLEEFAQEPLLLRLPLVRCGSELSVGDDPDAWARFVELAKTT
ncbi:MAG TPA: ArsC/Spx/MgsR family protein [Euzebyales bacterium]|nr:ArsC/Spx/MgsR family protein [Euzebyales bacterium]